MAVASDVASFAKFVLLSVLSVLVEKLLLMPPVVPDAPPVRWPLNVPPDNDDWLIVVATLMLLPAVPFANAVRVTVVPEPLTVTPTLPA